MLDPQLAKKINTFILENYCITELDTGQTSYFLEEHDDAGLSTLEVSCSSGNDNILCIANYDKLPRCEFLSQFEKYGMRKCVDHVLLVKQSSGKWMVHLIEMKTSVGEHTWVNIKQKVRASILNIKALAAVLDLPLENFMAYTTYENLAFDTRAPENPAERKSRLGVPGTKEDEWDKNLIKINLLNSSRDEYHHTGIPMVKSVADGINKLCGKLII